MIGKIGVRLALLVAIGVTIGCDRVTKDIAATTLARTPGRSFLADIVRLEYVENTGGFLSLGATLAPFARMAQFTIGTGLMLLVVIAAVTRCRWSDWPLLGFSLFVAGGASNWVDRVARGSVVDFINLGIGLVLAGLHWGKVPGPERGVRS